MGTEPHRTEGVGRERLEALREDVVAHVAAMSPAKRRELRGAVDATLARLDAELARLEESPTPAPLDDPRP